MPEPLLDIGDVGFVLEGIRGSRCPQGVEAKAIDMNPSLRSVGLGHLVDAITRDSAIEHPGAVVAQGPKEGTFAVLALPGELEVLVDGRQGRGVGATLGGLTLSQDPPGRMRGDFGTSRGD